MEVIEDKKFNKRIKNNFTYKFSSAKSGLYLIEIIASAKSWRQNIVQLRSFFRDDDLAVKIDGRSFPKLDGRRGLFDGEAAWNGNNLNGLSKTNAFFMRLEKGEHELYFFADQDPILERITIHHIQDSERKNLSYIPLNNPARNGNRRQWITLVLLDLSLKTLRIKAKVQQGKEFFLFKRDDSDIKLVIDGEIQKNNESKSHTYWYWCGRTLKGESKTFFRDVHLDVGVLHYIELWADRMPIIESVKLTTGRAGLPIGRVAIYKDVSNASFVYFREQPNEESKVITELAHGTMVFIKEKGIEGSRPAGLLSDLWHKVLYNNQEGFIHSSFIESEGQEREKIIAEIRFKARGLGIDEKLALSLAHCESSWLPFAHSGTGNKGIYQLGEDTIEEINKKYGGSITDPYDANQNIDGGLRYLQYLLDKYKKPSDSLARSLTAWSRGSKRVPRGGKFSIEEQSEGAQILLKCVLEEKRGEKILKALGLFIILVFAGFGAFSYSVHQREEADYLSKERSVYFSSDYTASFINEARKGEVILTNLEDDFDGDGTFEEIEFGFLSPEAFNYTTIVHSPNGETVDIYGSFSEAKARDLTNDGVKELILRVKSGKEFVFFIFAYTNETLRLLPTYSNLPNPYEGIWGISMDFEDLDGDSLLELVVHTADSFGVGRQSSYKVFEYYKWDGAGYYRYKKEKVYTFVEVCRSLTSS